MIRISARSAHILVDLARLVLFGALLGLAIRGWTGGVPRDPESALLNRQAEVPIQIGLAVLAAVGLALSFRWRHVSAVVVALAGSGLAVLSAIQHTPRFAVAVTLVFLVPAVMIWMAWQHTESFASIALIAVVTGLLLGVSWFGADRVYDRFYGATHPLSEKEALPPSAVRWLWSGDLRPDGFTVVARLRDEADEVWLEVVAEDGSVTARTPARPVVEDDDPVRFEIDGLPAGEQHNYRVVVNGVPDTTRTGSATTAPVGPAPLRMVVSACAQTGSSASVFDVMAAHEPDLYVMTGDLHYRDIDVDDEAVYAAAYTQVLTAPAQAALYREVPIAYVWDDHDFGPNDADGTSPSRRAAQAAYRSHVPHAELAVAEDGPIHHAFSWGRVRVLVTDTRSERLPDESPPVMLGADQVAWLEQELLAARDSHALTVWVNPTPWIAAERPGADHWGGYAEERRRISEFLAEHEVTNLLMLSGDAHMVAIDDGRNTGFDAEGSVRFPVLQAAALDRPGSVKGGPYSHGAFPGGGQYGLVDVTDDGETIEVTLSGRNWRGQTLTSLTFDFDAP